MTDLSNSTVALGEHMRVQNVDTTELAFMYARKVYRIPVGSEIWMPFEAIKLYFGDPRSTSSTSKIKDPETLQTQFIPDRAAEVLRLRQLYPPSKIVFTEVIPGDRSLLETGISDRVPRVHVFTITNERLYTVIDDPMGDRSIGAVAPTRFDSLQAQQIIDRQQKMLDAMMKRMGMTAADLTDADDTGSPRDADTDTNTDADADPRESSLPFDTDGIPHPRPELERIDPRVVPEAVIEENPGMVANPRNGRITRRTAAVADPTTLEQLPEDD